MRCALRVGLIPRDRATLLELLNGAIPDRTYQIDRRWYSPADLVDLVQGTFVEDDGRLPDEPKTEFIWRDQALSWVLNRIVERSPLGYVIESGQIRIMPWERAVEELVGRR